jgi:cytochrome b6-f complex iron-sulfur subunit
MSAIVEFFKAVAGICRTNPLGDHLWEFDGNRATVKIDQVAELQSPGGAVFLQGKGLKQPVLIVRGNEGGFHAFANRCTHMGRKLDPVPGEPVLRCCSVSHSTFDYHGQKLTGPAKGPVTVYHSEVQEGGLVITV